jgi:Skp family chaperone for outer membrane proteins
MKKTIITVIALATLITGPLATAQLGGGRIVTVDLNKVFNDYYKTPIASAKLKDTAEGLNKENEQLVTKFRLLREELDKLRDDLEKPEFSAEVKEQKKKELQTKLADLQKIQRDIEEFRRTNQRELEAQTQRMRQTILKEIIEVVNKEAKDAGYTFVLDKSGNTLNGVPGVVYSQDSSDITDSILKILNRNAPKTEAPAPKAPDTK